MAQAHEAETAALQGAAAQQPIARVDQVRVVTDWWHLRHDPDPDVAALNQVKDELFTWWVTSVLERLAPWLPPMLSASQACVMAGPGRFIVVLPDGGYFPLPDLALYMHLWPWVEPGEVRH